MTTFPRVGFARSNGSAAEEPIRCASGKSRYARESSALDALVRIRRKRTDTSRAPENKVYFCERCSGWHLSSAGAHPEDLTPIQERRPREDIWAYTRRLEKRIAEQRTQLLSLHALGYGAGNRESRKRIGTLVTALGRMTERWENERSHRQQLVAILDERCSCRRCRRRISRAADSPPRSVTGSHNPPTAPTPS